MPQLAPIALAAWVPITLALFARLPPRRAAWISLLGGWLLLPTARFDDAVAAVEFPYWIMPACLPGSAWFTKAHVIGASCLLGIAAFDGGRLRASRPRWVDLPLAIWCLCPVASAAANGLPMGEGLADAGYLATAWGAPYLAGRLYFAGPGGMVELARGIVDAGMASVPFCLVESFAGPWLYRAAYGFHPYESPGKVRYIGYRPIGFFEDGNQLGIWAATAAVAAVWLWRSGLMRTWRGLNGGAVAALLAAVAAGAQSVGAIASAALVLAALEALRRVDRVWPAAAVLAVTAALVGARAANVVDAKALAQGTAVGRSLIAASERAGRQSFGWRLRVEERGARVAVTRPVLGFGSWDWWGGGGERPWGLWILAFGMYGVVGLSALAGMGLVPLGRFLRAGPPRSWGTPQGGAAAALAAVLALNALDSLLNAAVVLPILAAAGALGGMRGGAGR